MPQFFIESYKIAGNKCIIDGNDYTHLIKVRRARLGDQVELRLKDGTLCTARIVEIGENSIAADVIHRVDIDTQAIDLTLYVSLLKGKQFDKVIKKAVEIGVNKIVPVLTERTIPDVAKKKRNSKLERWSRIAEEASKQSLRLHVPAVEDAALFKDIISTARTSIKILAHTGEQCSNLKEYLSRIIKKKDVSLLIGPEGGFSEHEIDLARKNGWADVMFGFTCMRAETAALVIPAILIYEWSTTDENNG